jgi:hypothetical protein
VGAWSPSLDRDLGPLIGVGWVGGLVLFVPRMQAGRVFFVVPSWAH